MQFPPSAFSSQAEVTYSCSLYGWWYQHLTWLHETIKLLSYVALVSYLTSVGLSFFIYIIGQSILFLPTSQVVIKLK